MEISSELSVLDIKSICEIPRMKSVQTVCLSLGQISNAYPNKSGRSCHDGLCTMNVFWKKNYFFDVAFYIYLEGSWVPLGV